MRTLWRWIVDALFSIGEHPGEDDTQRTQRRIFVTVTVIATTLTIPVVLDLVGQGSTKLAVSLGVVVVAGPLSLLILKSKPHWFTWVVQGVFTVVAGETFYDLWGDTVNTASRMESGGIAGKIQVSPATHDLLAGNGYRFEPRGTIEVKGKGTMETWLLTGKT